MFNYYVSFKGREVGAIGILSNYSFCIQAKTKEEVELKIYETHEHIMWLSIRKDIAFIDQEFKQGDIVTFKPYEEAIKARVLEVCKGYIFKDYSYKLEGVGKVPLNSHCTGNSIMESKYYQTI